VHISSDYTAVPDVTGFAPTFRLSNEQMSMRLTAEAIQLLSTSGPNQFRGRLSEKTFSNRNGALASPLSGKRAPC
jgi:hypothetical protein